jgi:hypothetical protein
MNKQFGVPDRWACQKRIALETYQVNHPDIVYKPPALHSLLTPIRPKQLG